MKLKDLVVIVTGGAAAIGADDCRTRQRDLCSEHDRTDTSCGSSRIAPREVSRLDHQRLEHSGQQGDCRLCKLRSEQSSVGASDALLAAGARADGCAGECRCVWTCGNRFSAGAHGLLRNRSRGSKSAGAQPHPIGSTRHPTGCGALDSRACKQRCRLGHRSGIQHRWRIFIGLNRSDAQCIDICQEDAPHPDPPPRCGGGNRH